MAIKLNEIVNALFVVDDPGSIDSVSKEFLSLGILPVATDNEYDAAQYVLGGQNRILLLDVALPKNKGLDILKHIRLKEKEKNIVGIPTIIFSEFVDEKIKNQARELGALDCIINPKDTLEKIAEKIKEADSKSKC